MRTVKQVKNSRHANSSPEDEFLRNILRREFVKSGLSQKDFAKKLGITPAFFSEILSGAKSGQRKAVQFFMRLGLADSVSENTSRAIVDAADPDIIEACQMVVKIYKANDKTKRALKENLHEFCRSVDAQAENERNKNTLSAVLDRQEKLVNDHNNLKSVVDALMLSHPELFESEFKDDKK